MAEQLRETWDIQARVDALEAEAEMLEAELEGQQGCLSEQLAEARRDGFAKKSLAELRDAEAQRRSDKLRQKSACAKIQSKYREHAKMQQLRFQAAIMLQVRARIWRRRRINAAKKIQRTYRKNPVAFAKGLAGAASGAVFQAGAATLRTFGLGRKPAAGAAAGAAAKKTAVKASSAVHQPVPAEGAGSSQKPGAAKAAPVAKAAAAAASLVPEAPTAAAQASGAGPALAAASAAPGAAKAAPAAASAAPGAAKAAPAAKAAAAATSPAPEVPAEGAGSSRK